MKITIKLDGLTRNELLDLRSVLDVYFYNDSFDCPAEECETCPKRVACDSVVNAMVKLAKAAKAVEA